MEFFGMRNCRGCIGDYMYMFKLCLKTEHLDKFLMINQQMHEMHQIVYFIRYRLLKMVVKCYSYNSI